MTGARSFLQKSVATHTQMRQSPRVMSNTNRVLETVTGRDEAIEVVASFIRAFNDCNGAGRMIPEGEGLRAYDNEGSGEFYEAVCLNLNTAESCAAEIYEIQTAW